MMCNILFAILNPGKYFELADYYHFVLTICIIGFFHFSFKGFLSPHNSIEQYSFICLLWMIIPFFVAHFVVGQISSAYCLSFIIYFLFLYICIKYRFTHFEIRKILYAYTISGSIVGILIITQNTLYYDIDARYSVQLFDNQMFDPNYLAAFLVFPCIVSFMRIMYSSSISKAIFDSCCLFIIIVGLFMTGSRNAMLSFCLGALFVYFQRFSIKLTPQSVIVILIAAFVVVPVIASYLPEETYLRLFVNSYDDGSNAKRLIDWKAGWDTFLQHPFLGYGFTAEMDAISFALKKHLVAHNTYLGFLIQFGIVGFLLFTTGIIHIIKSLYAKSEFALLGTVFATLQLSLVVSAQVAFFFWIPIVIIVSIVNDMNYNKKLIIKDYL
jgi:O-antigen ligase